ncbi:MAG: hypothetical protein ABI763_09675 [Bacteroidota bacterium]
MKFVLETEPETSVVGHFRLCFSLRKMQSFCVAQSHKERKVITPFLEILLGFAAFATLRDYLKACLQKGN